MNSVENERSSVQERSEKELIDASRAFAAEDRARSWWVLFSTTGLLTATTVASLSGVKVQPRESWSYTRAALESSSYLEMGSVMRYFAGNIGYHHVHHLNSPIPFYRLPEAMAAIPELRHPTVTRLTLREIAACLRLKLWDPEAGEMVGYPVDAADVQPLRDAARNA